MIIDFQGMGSTGDRWVVKTEKFSPENNTLMTPEGDMYGFGIVLLDNLLPYLGAMKAYNDLKNLSTKELVTQRMDKYTNMGVFKG